jgi:hypothetical protein
VSSDLEGGMGSGKSSAEAKREQRLKVVEDHIGRAIAESAASGELQSAPSYGKPMNFGDGYDETPAELRMGYKILKDAGIVPPEVELMREIEALRGQLDAMVEGEEAVLLRQRIVDKRLLLSLRLERLRATGAP